MSVTLKHLNADTSWLISVDGFQILLDPWFFGTQSDFFRFFSTQAHAITPSVQSISRDLGTNIDAVIISHEFTDHCHEETLRTLPCTVPIFATYNAYKRIQRWRYFKHVYEIPTLNDCLERFTLSILTKQSSTLNMPNTISVGYLPEKGWMALPALHGATCISFLVNNNHWHSLLYIPHGCGSTSITDWVNRQANVTILALMQGFDRVSNPIWLGGLLNYGCEEAAKLAIAVRARHWIATHDEDKVASGLVAKFLKRQYWKLSDAQMHLEKHIKSNVNQPTLTLVHDVLNGESLTLPFND